MRDMKLAILNAVDSDTVADVVRRLAEDAGHGDARSADILLSYMVGRSKGETVRVELPRVVDEASAVAAHQEVLRAVSCGEISAEAGERLILIIDKTAQAAVYHELRRRLDRFQEANGHGIDQ